MTAVRRLQVLRALEDLFVIVLGYFAARHGLPFSVAYCGVVLYFLGSRYLRSPRIPEPPRQVLPGPWSVAPPGARLPEQHR